jgi:hypothetical protein
MELHASQFWPAGVLVSPQDISCTSTYKAVTSTLSALTSPPFRPAPTAVHYQRHHFYVQGMGLDLSIVPFVCAWFFHGLSCAHIYLWNGKHPFYSIRARIAFGGLMILIAPFAYWQLCKVLPTLPKSTSGLENLLVVIVPWIHGLSIVVRFYSLA